MTTIEELKRAAEQEQLRTLAGLGAKTEERILKALAEKKQEPSDRRAARATGSAALLAVVDVLQRASRRRQGVRGRAARGGARRRSATSTSSRRRGIRAALTDYFTKLRGCIEVAAKGPTKATVVSNEGLRFDLRVVPPECYGNLLQHFTGSKEHNVALRERAVQARPLRLRVRRSRWSRQARC